MHVASGAGATLYISPASGSYAVGRTFTVAVRVDTAGQAINAGEAALSYNPDVLEAVSISTEGSIFSIWTQEPTFSNYSGSLTFSGGLPSPGFNGPAGLLFSVAFRTKAAGSVSILFVSGAILANDGQGTNILEGSRSANYAASASTPTPKPLPLPTPSAIVPNPPASPVVSSPTHPVNSLAESGSGGWDFKRNVEFNWTAAPDVTSFSHVFDRTPTTVPDTTSDGAVTYATFTDTADGVWYFHIRGGNAGGWSDAAHYGVRIDATMPEPFDIEVIGGQDITDPTPEVRFSSKDLSSGIAYYSLQLPGDEARRINPEEAQQALEIGPLESGIYALRVIAYDRAGNARDAFREFTIHALAPPVITAYPKTLADDEMMFLDGTAPPKSTVVVRFIDPEGNEATARKIASDEAGNWNYFGKPLKGRGDWRIAAHTENSEGAVSKESEVVISILATGLSVGPYRVTFASAYGIGGAILAFAFIAALAALVMLRKRVGRLSRSLAKEIYEAEDALRLGFQTLREDVLLELRNLDALQKIRPLIPEEQNRRERLLRDLAFIEFRITKEVHDIEDVLGAYRMRPAQTAQSAMPEAPNPNR
ncbi:MAG: cohesin domain-containing protein [bacterium]|nr:cohesin domain-containing protein [bacterium]